MRIGRRKIIQDPDGRNTVASSASVKKKERAVLSRREAPGLCYSIKL